MGKKERYGENPESVGYPSGKDLNNGVFRTNAALTPTTE